jgi:hypothetical protein
MTLPAASRIHKLVGEVLAPGEPSPPELNPSEWDALWRCARTHGLTPYLHQRWLEAGVLGRLPPEVARRYAQARSQNEERNRRILRELEEICGSLQQQGISHQVLKGLPLSQTYYGDPSLRLLYDVDLLIREPDGPRALRRLRRMGYEPFHRLSQARDESLGLLWRPKEYAWDAERVFDPERPLFVELHTRPWQPRWHGFRIECDLDFWDGHRVERIDGVELMVPSEESHLVQLAVHYAFNTLESNARLMHLLDVALLLRRSGAQLDWNRTLREIEANRVAPFCFLTLELARRICRSEIPDHLRHALRARTPERIAVWLESEGVQAAHAMSVYERDRSRIYFLHWAIASGWSEKLRVLWYALLSPWQEGSGFGRLVSFTRRMAQRTRHLLRSFSGWKGA